MKYRPLAVAKECWPDVDFYTRQREIFDSVWENGETVVTAGNKMGKDFVAAAITLIYFLTHHPCKIITTSATEKHLDTLWGEMDRFIRTSRIPLTVDKGGPLVYNHRHIVKRFNGVDHKETFIRGVVASSENKGEGLSGHHAKYTLFVVDEASGVADVAYSMAQGWAKRMLIIGNPFPCSNFFRRAVKGGDIWSPELNRYLRKVLRICADDIPNIVAGKACRGGDGANLMPGVLSYEEYLARRQTWDEQRQCVGLDGLFYEGAAVLLFPPSRLARAEELGRRLVGERRTALAIGIDSGEGSANTTWTAVDELGVIEQLSKKTPDTNVIPGETIAFGRRHGVPPNHWVFDRGGGGKQHADRLRDQGYPVRTIGFGEGVTLEPRRGLHQLADRKEVAEDRYAYKNRRAQMYGEASLLFEDDSEFGLAPGCGELVRQLSVVPKQYDEEGRLKMPPKQRRDEKDGRTTMEDLLGCSPDEADSFVLAVHDMLHPASRMSAGVI